MKKILFMFVLFFSSYAFSGECIVFDNNDKQTIQSCEVQLLGGGEDWVSEKIVMRDRQFYLKLGGCTEDLRAGVCSNIQFATDELGLFLDDSPAVIYSLNKEMKPVKYDSDVDWTCLKSESNSLNVCFKN